MSGFPTVIRRLSPDSALAVLAPLPADPAALVNRASAALVAREEQSATYEFARDAACGPSSGWSCSTSSP